MYNDTSKFLEKGEYVLGWGDVYQMFKNKSFATNAKDHEELNIFKNIRKSVIFTIATRVPIFPCSDAIFWIPKQVDVGNRLVFNAREEPIA
jgi:hypothetical protein